MPKNERDLQWHQSPRMLGHQARGVVRSRASGRNKSPIGEGTIRANQAFATTHGLPDRVGIFPPIRVKFDPHSFGVHIANQDLNLEKISPVLLLNGGGTEAQGCPVLGQFSLPGDQIGSQ